MNRYKTRSRKISISRLIVLFMIILIILQAVLFVLVISASGTERELEQGAQTFIAKNLAFNRLLLERKMEGTWGNLDNLKGVIRFAKSIKDPHLHSSQSALINYMLHALQLLGAHGMTVVLYGEGGDDVVLSLKDMNPDVSLYDYSDNYLMAGNHKLAADVGITVDANWKSMQQLLADIPHAVYREKAEKLSTRAAVKNDKAVSAWEYFIDDKGKKYWHFLTPIIGSQNFDPVGYIFVEIDMDDVLETFYYDEKYEHSIVGYALGRADKAKCPVGDVAEIEIMGGAGASNFLFDEDKISIRRIENTHEAMYESMDSTFVKVGDGENGGDSTYILFLSSVRVINTEGYADYYLLLVVDRLLLEQPVRAFDNGIMFVLAGSVFIGALLTMFLTRRLSANMARITEQVRNLAHEGADIDLRESSIYEFDTLLEEIRKLRGSLRESSSKFQSIFDLVEFPVIALEIDEKAGLVYKVGKLTEFLGPFEESETLDVFNQQIDIEIYQKYRMLFLERHRKYMSYFNDDDSRIEIWESLDEDEKRFFKVVTDTRAKTVIDTEGAVGKSMAKKMVTLKVITDCTEDILEQNKIKEQRDKDSLTGLLNRFSFKEKVEQIMADGCKKAAMVMWDLDELKFVNDAYGHDMGDLYIKAMADVLRRLDSETSAVARISGDEFFAFISYTGGKSEVRDSIVKIREALLAAELYFSERNMSIRATTGIAWYPDDASNVHDLYKYADFAMYSAKRTDKGTIAEFNREEFDHNYIFMIGNQHFEDFIRDRLVKFAFQPIVDSRTGEVFAYEALMRPTSEYIKSVEHVLKIARQQHRLREVETLTMETVLGYVADHPEVFDHKRVFINSIANVAMNEKQVYNLDQKYSEQFSKFVIEIIEQEDIEHECLKIKQDAKRKLSMQIAIDDYGNGYSNRSWLVSVHPDYVKIDMALIRGVEEDEDKREVIRNIIETSKRLGIHTICEGVETYPEMKTLIRMGVDYLQGYYIGKPKFEAGGISDKVKEEIVQLNIIRH